MCSGAVEQNLDASGYLKVVAIRRQPIFQRLDDVESCATRFARHEPITDVDLAMRNTRIVETIPWICQTPSAWVGSLCGKRYSVRSHLRSVRSAMSEIPLIFEVAHYRFL